MERFTIERVRQQLVISFPTLTAAVKALEELNTVTKMTGQKKNRSYSYQAIVVLQRLQRYRGATRAPQLESNGPFTESRMSQRASSGRMRAVCCCEPQGVH